MEYYENVRSSLNPPINNFMDGIVGKSNPGEADSIGLIVLKMVLILYGSIIAPKLPVYVLEWFDFVPFKIAVLFLIVWSGSHDPSLALLIAICFYASLNVLNGKQMFEKFEALEEGEYQGEEESDNFFPEEAFEDQETETTDTSQFMEGGDYTEETGAPVDF
jgi:hypothetical protein